MESFRAIEPAKQHLRLISLLWTVCCTFISITLIAAPPADPTGFSASPADSQIDLIWTNPAAFDEILVIAGTSVITHSPSGDGSAYTANSNFGDGTVVEPGEFIVYKGTGTSIAITGLTNSTTYHFEVFARGGTGGTEWSTGTVTTSETPLPDPITGGSFTSTCIDEGTVDWTNPTIFYNIVVFAKEGSAITVGTPTADPTTITASSNFGSGDVYENDASAFCVYNGAAETIDITGLNTNTDYHFLIFNVQDAPTSYSTDITFNNFTASTVSNASSLTATPADGEIDLVWTNPSTCFDEVLVVASVNNAVSVTPTGDGTAYTANNAYGSGHDFGGGDFAVYKGTGTNVTVTGLTNGTTYHFEIFARRGTTWSSGGVTDNAQAVDLTPPVVTVYDPADGSAVAVGLTTLTLTFDDDIQKVSGSPSSNAGRIRLFENGAQVLAIDRNNAGIVASSNQVTIDVSGYTFIEGANYYVLIGNSVLENDPGGVNFAGISDPTTWNFIVAGTIVIPPATLNLCENSPARTLGNIIIEESVPDDFTSAGTVVYELDPTTGFVFEPGTGSVSFESINNGNDIDNISINVSFTSFTLTYTFDDASNISTDRIVISGLKLSSDGTTGTTEVKRTGGSAVMNANEVADDKVHATINTGAAPSTPGSITTSPSPFKACIGDDLTTYSVTVGTGTSNLKWYSDAALSTPIAAADGLDNPTAAQLGLTSISSGTFTVYVTQTTTCESNGVAVSFTVNPIPVADAGTDAQIFCDSESIYLGGSPTLSNPSVPGSYTYIWTELTGAPVTVNPASIPSISNPSVTVTNNTGAIQSLQFEVVITDANGCFSTDVKDLDVRSALTPSLTAPTSTSFGPNGSAQGLSANPSGGTFSGIGVVQSGGSTYEFDPTVAYDNTQPLPQNIPIYYSVTDGNACSVSNFLISTFTLSNQTFTNVSAEYCSDEYPSGNGVQLAADFNAETSVLNRVNSWNNSTRYNYFPANWFSGNYTAGDRVRYGNEVYQANNTFFSTIDPPSDLINWTLISNFLMTKWNGMIRNYYEGYYGGNNASATIIKLGSTYASPTGLPTSYNHYGMRTIPNYNNCPSCSYMYPATYVEFVNPADIAFILSQWNVGGFYSLGSIVRYTVSPGNTRIYRSIASSNQGNTPNLSPSFWQDVTNANWDNGNYFHINDGGFRSGFYNSGQFVAVNRNPVAQFAGLNSGLTNPSEFCNTDQNFILDGNFPSAGNFTMSYDNVTYSTLTGLQNAVPGAGQATFNSENAYINAPGSGSKPFYIKYAYDPGTTGSSGQACLGQQIQAINVNPLPTISFTSPTPPNNEIFCYDGAAVNLSASQTSNVTFSGLGVSNVAGGTGKFDPLQAYSDREDELGVELTTPQDFIISVTYTHPTTECQNSATRTYQVRPLPPATFSFGNKFDYCYEDDNQMLDGQNPSGKYTIYYVIDPTNKILIETVNNPDYDFDPSYIYELAVNQGANNTTTLSFEVIYATNDPVKTDCINTQIEQFTVSPFIPVEILGVENQEIFCANEGSRRLTMSQPGGILTIDGISVPLVNGQIYNLDRNPDGGEDIVLTYVHTTGTGCTSTASDTITILPSPNASFIVPPKCDGDMISFESLNNDYVQTVTWDFGDNIIESGPVATFGTVQHTYANPNQYLVKLILEGNTSLPLTCIDSTDQFVTVGSIPAAYFDFQNVCQEDLTTFQGTSTNGTFITSYSWDFGDGDILSSNVGTNPIPTGTHGGRTTGTYANPVHQYASGGTYVVNLIGRSQPVQGACPDEYERELSILTNIAVSASSPYSMEALNGGDGLWKIEDINDSSTWEFGIPNGTIIKSDEAAWTTNLTDSYKALDKSYVNSPCFDMSTFERPVISLDIWSDTQRESDGAVLQYSIDGGGSWQTLGLVQNGISSGLNWYNQTGITGSPGGQSLYGWSRVGDLDWSNARHSLDAVPLPRDNVRIRVAFGSNGDTQLDGFAFKNVLIEERNKIVLLEHFTNTATPTNADNYVRSFNNNIAEAVKIEYRTNFPEADPRNQSNKADNNSRVSYYGITESPRTLLDGDSQNGSITTWGDLAYSKKTLNTSPLSIDVQSSIVDETLSIDVTISADAPVQDDNSVLHVLLVEKDADAANYIYQMVKMLPNAAGTKLNNGQPIQQGESFNINLITNITSPLDPSISAIVAFVQNEDTKLVYQSAIENTITLPPVVTGLINTDENEILIYPNPVNSTLNIEFGWNLLNGTLRVYDNFGKLVIEKAITQQSMSFITDIMASGLYHLQITNNNIEINRRVIIAHHK